MKVAFCNRPLWNNPLGGDGVQMLKTKEYLEQEFKLEIDIVTSPEQLDSSYDIVHVFNFVTWEVTESFYKKALELDIPIVGSSIFWDYTFAYDRITNLFVTNKISSFSAYFLKLFIHVSVTLTGYPFFLSRKFRRKVNYFVCNSKAVLPNSIEEGQLLLNFIQKNDFTSKIHIVYNGAENSVNEIHLSEEQFLHKYSIPSDYILQVGRIEPVKNQINLVYALKDNPTIPIVFVGRIANYKYYKKLKKISDYRGNVYFIDAIPHNEIAAFYKYAAIHVLLSLRESPGLVSLEALCNQCPIVISSANYVPVSTYFPDQKYIVDPFDFRDIKNVILKAYSERELHNELVEKFSWKVAAQQTYDAYKKILS